MTTNNQKGFIGRKALLLMALIFSFFSFCLLQKLTLITNTVTNSKNNRVVSRFSAPKQKLEKLGLNPKATSGKLSHETSRALNASNTIKRRDLKEMVAIFERHGWVWLEQKDSPQFQK